jgi:hypothetical protein
MILPELVILSRVNQTFAESGLDSLTQCPDKDHFINYPYKVEYCYNSRGFRDQEWPESIDDLQNSIWCIGDSFTAGIGSPLLHTWPQVLQQNIKKRVINVSMDGASNEWIARRTLDIANRIQPKHIIIMWSYFHRREDPDSRLTDEARRIEYAKTTANDDIENFLNCINQVKRNTQSQIIHFCIPGVVAVVDQVSDITRSWNNFKGDDWPQNPPVTIEEMEKLPNWVIRELKYKFNYYNKLKDLLSTLESADVVSKINGLYIPVLQIDRARDYHHFDLLTSQQVATTAALQLIG